MSKLFGGLTVWVLAGAVCMGCSTDQSMHGDHASRMIEPNKVAAPDGSPPSPASGSQTADAWDGDDDCDAPSPRERGLAIKCDSVSSPVCGCDGKTYVNACQAAGIGGVNVRSMGPCESEE
jgi:hypothetical protein